MDNSNDRWAMCRSVVILKKWNPLELDHVQKIFLKVTYVRLFTDRLRQRSQLLPPFPRRRDLCRDRSRTAGPPGEAPGSSSQRGSRVRRGEVGDLEAIRLVGEASLGSRDRRWSLWQGGECRRWLGGVVRALRLVASPTFRYRKVWQRGSSAQHGLSMTVVWFQEH